MFTIAAQKDGIVSYYRAEHRPAAERLKKVLEAAGYTVWFLFD